MKILVIAMAGVGDTILATPLIRELRANYPDARIDALVLWAASKDVLEGNPDLNNVYQRNLIKASKAQALQFLMPLRKIGYDISINAHPQSRIHYRLAARIIGAPIRLSHDYECSGWLDRWLVNTTIPQDYNLHSVENTLELLSLLGRKPIFPEHDLQIFLSPPEHDWAESFLSTHKLAQRQTLGMHVGSGGTKNLMLKRWPLEHYIALLQQIRAQLPELGILLFGGPEEEADIQKILAIDHLPLVIRVESKTLKQAAALMQRCSAFLSVDTALMHVAAAVKVPHQIVIEAFTLNKTNEPYRNRFELVRNPAIAGRNLNYYRYDGHGIKGTREELIRAMASVTVEAVLAAVIRALDSHV